MPIHHQDLSPLCKQYHSWLLLEKSLSGNSIEAYFADLMKLEQFASGMSIPLESLSYQDIQTFMATLYDLGISAKSTARILAGIRSFYRFMILEGHIAIDPTELIDSPKLGFSLPEVMTVEQVNRIIYSIDLSDPLGQRNRAMLELLYSCGLRVSELCHLQISDVYIEQEFVKVRGKGRKERLVPISKTAIREIELYMMDRNKQTIKPGCDNILFLNRRGEGIKRIMVFNIVKKQAQIAQLSDKISPHTFRHSFATHLLEGGANLIAIQRMLGHESVVTTEKYTHLDREFLRSEILSCHPRNNKQRGAL